MEELYPKGAIVVILSTVAARKIIITALKCTSVSKVIFNVNFGVTEVIF
jgi:hypothetical protein